jgi:hypothetical protein
MSSHSDVAWVKCFGCTYVFVCALTLPVYTVHRDTCSGSFMMFFAARALWFGFHCSTVMAPPKCRCCNSDSTELENTKLQRLWHWERGLKWDFHNGLAYWFLCVACHTNTWTTDFRRKGPYSKPGWLKWSCDGGGLTSKHKGRRLLLGDVFSTQAVPEFLRPAALETASLEPPSQKRQTLVDVFLASLQPKLRFRSPSIQNEHRKAGYWFCVGGR